MKPLGVILLSKKDEFIFDVAVLSNESKRLDVWEREGYNALMVPVARIMELFDKLFDSDGGYSCKELLEALSSGQSGRVSVS